MPDVTTTPPFAVAGEDAIIPPERHAMIGSSLVTGRMLCSCGKVLLWRADDEWDGHLIDVLSGDDGDAGQDEDAPLEGEPEPRGMSEASRREWRAEKGIPETPREQMPSRQDRRDEYDRRNAKRRRERALAQREASSASGVGSHHSGTP